MKDKLSQITTIYPDGSAATSIAVPALKVLQQLVGGDIQMVPDFTDFQGFRCTVWCHEEGRINGLPLNTHATILWRQENPFEPERFISRRDYETCFRLHGPVVIVQSVRPVSESTDTTQGAL